MLKLIHLIFKVNKNGVLSKYDEQTNKDYLIYYISNKADI